MNHSGLHESGLGVRVDLEYLVHVASELQEDARSTGITGDRRASAPCGDGNAGGETDLHCRRYVCRSAREGHKARYLTIERSVAGMRRPGGAIRLHILEAGVAESASESARRGHA
jgi:hypothetical protein